MIILITLEIKSPEQIKEEDDHEVGMGLSSLKSSVRSLRSFMII